MFRRKRSEGPGQRIVPEPVAHVTQVLNDLWRAYYLERHRGAEPDAAMQISLTSLIGTQDIDRVFAYLNGDLDAEFGITGDASGLAFRAMLLENAESGYQEVRSLPSWPPETG